MASDASKNNPDGDPPEQTNNGGLRPCNRCFRSPHDDYHQATNTTTCCKGCGKYDTMCREEEEDATEYYESRSKDVTANQNGDEGDECNIDTHGNQPSRYYPEGGWGWVVVVSSFFNSFIFDGIGSSFGVLYPYVQETFHSSAFVTSFAGSMFAAYLMMGSIAAILIKKFGFRAVSFVGGLLSCVAFVMASRASNIYLFLLTYGVLGGVSAGLVYLPSMVIVNGYFNKRRGITNGIVSSGSGMGVLVLAPVTNALLDYYSLGGTVLILAGVLLNICVFSCCFRQPAVYDPNKNDEIGCQGKEAVGLLTDNNADESRSNDDDDDDTQESTLDNSLECVQDNMSGKRNNDVRDKDEQITETTGNFAPKQETEVANPTLLLTPCLDSQRQDCYAKPRALRPVDNFLFRELKTNHSQSAGKLNMEKTEETSWMRSLNLLNVKSAIDPLEIRSSHKKHSSSHHRSTNVFTDIGANSYLTGSISRLVHIHNQHFASAHHLPAVSPHSHRSNPSLPASQTNAMTGRTVHHRAIPNLTPTERGDSFSEVAKQLRIRSSQEDLQSPSKSDDTQCSIVEIIPETSGYNLRQLLRMGSFYLFCLGACLIQLGYPVPSIFLSDLAATHGIPHHYGALMISLIGSFNIGGRLLGGALGNLNFNPIQLNDIALFFAAVMCFLCPLFTTMWSLCIFSASYGFLLGFFPPLQPLIIVKYFGIGSLASTFGFVTSLKGVAGLIGPPLAGWIYDVSHDYSISIVFAGVVFLLSVIVNETLLYSTRRRT